MKPLQSIAATLRAAREDKGLSQFALGQRVGLPQSHISKIEQGAVDLQASSLIQLARALDLELALLPRSALTVIQALHPLARVQAVDQDLAQLARKARALKSQFPRPKVLTALVNLTKDLRKVTLGPSGASDVRHLAASIDAALDSFRKQDNETTASRLEELLDTIEVNTEKLRQIRNALVHGRVQRAISAVPAYRLDEDEEDHG